MEYLSLLIFFFSFLFVCLFVCFASDCTVPSDTTTATATSATTNTNQDGNNGDDNNAATDEEKNGEYNYISKAQMAALTSVFSRLSNIDLKKKLT